jgi:hypothetical protein
VILTANGATATITIGGHVDPAGKTCRYLSQAVEAAAEFRLGASHRLPRCEPRVATAEEFWRK